MFISSEEIRNKFLEFFKERGHIIVPSASIIPENDPTTLFTGSGMQPMVPFLLGEKHPLGKRIANSQKAFRSEDIEEVGDKEHTTFFEMLGNWSLGDYFKKEQLTWIFAFLTEILRINPQKIYVTVFRGNDSLKIEKDEETVMIWKEIFSQAGVEAKVVDFSEDKGMSGGRIFYYDEKQNWWSRSGSPEKMPVGEIGGTDSEIYYDLGEELRLHEKSPLKDKPCHVACDCGRFIEIGNSVFMEYQKTINGFERLKQKNVDFGGGLERISMVVQGKKSVFETDLFREIINKIEELSLGFKYEENIKSFEIIADHLKAAVFILGENRGVVPSNLDQGYVVRRLIRRSIRYARKINLKENGWTTKIAEVVAVIYKNIYPEIYRNLDFIKEQLIKEEKRFSATLLKGLKEFNRIARMEEVDNYRINGSKAFDLYQTYGFPIEMTEELAKERGMEVDTEHFKKELLKHRELSRNSAKKKFKGGLADSKEKTIKLHTAAHLMLAGLKKTLGSGVKQCGANINEERLRFDFSYPQKMTPEEIREVENYVNEAIKKDIKIKVEEMKLEEARKKGAEGVFENKYNKDKVKVYLIEGYSQEICGGPHVEKTGILGKFKIIKEQSSSAGVRRIKAILEN